jgi:hypothetical protein
MALAALALLALLIIGVSCGLNLADQAANGRDSHTGLAPAGIGPSANVVDKAGPYTNDGMGISLTLLDDWKLYESDTLPNELLTIAPVNNEEAFVWIDRYPNLTVQDFLDEKGDWLAAYSLGAGEATTLILSEDTVEQKGITWSETRFNVTNDDERHSVVLYVADMPNEKGLLMYAVFAPVDTAEKQEHAALVDGLAMFKTLDFLS